MGLTPLTRISASSSRTSSQPELDRSEAFRTALAGVRTLNSLNIPGKEFSIVRDPDSHKFIVRVVDPATGEAIDQFPPEAILKMLSELEPASESTTEGAAE
jgi:uncharacterized FlaG/YvyC family protein